MSLAPSPVTPGVVQVSADATILKSWRRALGNKLYVVDNLEIPNINHFGTQGATGGPLSFINLDFVNDVTFSHKMPSVHNKTATSSPLS